MVDRFPVLKRDIYFRGLYPFHELERLIVALGMPDAQAILDDFRTRGRIKDLKVSPVTRYFYRGGSSDGGAHLHCPAAPPSLPPRAAVAASPAHRHQRARLRPGDIARRSRPAHPRPRAAGAPGDAGRPPRAARPVDAVRYLHAVAAGLPALRAGSGGAGGNQSRHHRQPTARARAAERACRPLHAFRRARQRRARLRCVQGRAGDAAGPDRRPSAAVQRQRRLRSPRHRRPAQAAACRRGLLRADRKRLRRAARPELLPGLRAARPSRAGVPLVLAGLPAAEREGLRGAAGRNLPEPGDARRRLPG